MTKVKFPTPKYWLTIEVCEAIYKAFKNYASQFRLSPPMPNFETRYPNRLESILGNVELRASFFQYDIVEVAVFYFVSLSKSQVFLDGNKRMAVIATNAFLKFNGYELKVNPNRLRNISILVSKDESTNIEESVKLLIPLLRKYIKKV